jgi:hypothetical protein
VAYRRKEEKKKEERRKKKEERRKKKEERRKKKEEREVRGNREKDDIGRWIVRSTQSLHFICAVDCCYAVWAFRRTVLGWFLHSTLCA